MINSRECKIYNTKKIKLTLYYVIIRIAKFKQYFVHIIIRHVVLLTVMEHAINKIKYPMVYLDMCALSVYTYPMVYLDMCALSVYTYPTVYLDICALSVYTYPMVYLDMCALSVYTYPIVYFIQFHFTYTVSNWDPNLHFMSQFM